MTYILISAEGIDVMIVIIISNNIAINFTLNNNSCDVDNLTDRYTTFLTIDFIS